MDNNGKRNSSVAAGITAVVVIVVAAIVGWLLIAYVIIPSMTPKAKVVVGGQNNAQVAREIIKQATKEAARVDQGEAVTGPPVVDAVTAAPNSIPSSLSMTPLDEINTFEADASLGESKSGNTAGDFKRMQNDILKGMRKSFRSGKVDKEIAEQLGVNLPTLEGSRWALANERVLAYRDGFNQRKVSKVLGMYTDLRPKPPRIPDYNMSRLLLFGISESQTNADGSMPPGGVEGL